MTPTRRRFMQGLFSVAAVAAVPIDALTALVGKPTQFAPVMRARYSDLVTQVLRARSARLADGVTQNNALLMKLKSGASIKFEGGGDRIASMETDA